MKGRKGRKLVAYFSATGTTKAVAERLAKAADADLFEITPAEPYTDADLDWHDMESRSSREMEDPQALPLIAGDVPDMSDYLVVFLGFPIWWYRAPKIINTFLESCDLRDKALVLFATSGSSGMGKLAWKLAPSAPDVHWIGSRRLEADVPESELAAWVGRLGV